MEFDFQSSIRSAFNCYGPELIAILVIIIFLTLGTLFANELNKKSELMLMRRARAYSSSCSQVILVCLHSFCRSSLFAAIIHQKITKNPYF